jgi:GT2 family glycosyltransferase/glycosyltransferase involved in cell wall biosynthesis
MGSITPETLQQAGDIAWAIFDRDWYLAAYPDAARSGASLDFDGVLDFYIRHGQALGHSPNPFFDEQWYIGRYPAIASLVQQGAYSSGFDHYHQAGYLDNDPHWLFDLKLYRGNNADLTLAALRSAGHRDHYNHYLLTGVGENRRPHLFFDAGIYQVGAENRGPETIGGSFGRYLRQLRSDVAEPKTTIYFDPDWYKASYPQAARAVARGEWRSALHHYLCNRTPELFDPRPEFSEAFYRIHNRDVAKALSEGRYDGRAYWHFLYNGARELRAPNARIDLRYYRDQHAEVGQAIAAGSAPNAFAHLLTTGLMQGLNTLPPVDQPPEEAQAKALFRVTAANLLPGLARAGIDFTFVGQPDLSVILVVHDQFALTMRTLASLRQNHAGAVELILVDSGSTDETRHLRAYVSGARIVSFGTNIGYLRGCNAALNFVTSDLVLYLNNDIELAPSAIAAAIRRLQSDAKIGAVGAKVIRTHGRLQEAGCVVWRNGGTQGYLRDASPQAPEANFVRDVDFCSAVFLLARAELLRKLEGFDDAYAPAYYEDADLCIRIAAAGYRIVYDPAVVVSHLEYGTAASSLDAQAQMSRGHGIFTEKHSTWLAARMAPALENLLWARTAGQVRRRVLFIEDMPPLRLVGSGYVRSNDVVRVMVALGMQVTIFPTEPRQFELAAVFADLPDEVEVMHDRSIADLPGFIAERAGYYDIVWIGRTHNLDRTAAMLPGLAGPGGAMPRLILDTEAVAALRDAARRLAFGEQEGASGVAAELANAPICEQVIAVSEPEAALLRGLGLPRVSVIGHMVEIQDTGRPWKDRAGMLFVGAIHAMESPNYDSLCWFVDEVLPLVERELGWETRLTIAGYTSPSVDLSRFAQHSRITLRGTVADLVPLYDQHRLFVAPTRFAAGIPYKVHGAAAHGLPIVATTLLQRQLEWHDGTEILTADDKDPAAFARHILSLYRSEALWQAIRLGAFARLRQDNSRAAYTDAVCRVMAAPADQHFVSAT